MVGRLRGACLLRWRLRSKLRHQRLSVLALRPSRFRTQANAFSVSNRGRNIELLTCSYLGSSLALVVLIGLYLIESVGLL